MGSIDLAAFFGFIQDLWECLPAEIFPLLGVLVMFSVLSSFHGKFGGDNH